MAKVIPLKVLGKDDGLKINYLEMFKVAVSSPDDPKIGLSVEEIRRSVKILDILDGAKGSSEVVLEDAEYEYLKRKIMGHKYQVAFKDLVTYFDDVEYAKAPEAKTD